MTATKQPGGHIPTGNINFDEKVIDHSNSFDSGAFKAPSSGNYLFLFDSYVGCPATYDACPAEVTVYVHNGLTNRKSQVYNFQEQWNRNGVNSFRHRLKFMFASKLEEGDRLFLVNQNVQTLLNSASTPMTFFFFLISISQFCCPKHIYL